MGNTTTGDTGLGRNAAGVVESNNGTAGQFRDFAARNYLIEGTSSGVVTVTGAAAAGTWTFTLPTSGGTANYAMTTNGSGTASWVDGQSIVSLTTSSTPQFLRLGVGNAADSAFQLMATSYGSATTFNGRSAEGTSGSPTASLSGDVLYKLQSSGYTGSVFREASSMRLL